jgi:hypothetical protein
VIGVTPTDARFMVAAGHGVLADPVHRRTSPETGVRLSTAPSRLLPCECHDVRIRHHLLTSRGRCGDGSWHAAAFP